VGNLFTARVGNILTVPLGNIFTAEVGKVLDIYTGACLAVSRRRRADSISSDIVHPRRAASCFRRVMTESSIFKVVFMHITIR
jgi:hypothetical protein